MPDTPPHTRASLEAFLRAHEISFAAHAHPPVYTVAEADAATGYLPGTPTKNLFLRDDTGRRHILVTIAAAKRVNLKHLGETLGAKKLGFASAERLRERIGLEPGSVTILGLINDREQRVECIVDRTVWEADALQCHPLTNSATLVLPKSSLVRFLEVIGREPTIIDIPEG